MAVVMNQILKLVIWGVLWTVGPFVIALICVWAAIEAEMERRRAKTS